MIKMYCIFSRESVEAMKGNKGKMCAQAGHAYLHAWWNADELQQKLVNALDNHSFHLRKVMREYKEGNDARKICLITDTTDELRELVDAYHGYTGTTLVEDCGYTVVEPGTITCAGIGPLRDENKGDDLRELELFLA